MENTKAERKFSKLPNISLTTKAGLAMLATAMVLLYIGGVASQQLQPGGTVNRTQEALFELEETMNAYSDFRTNELSYVLSGDPYSLSIISDAGNKMLIHLDRMSQLLAERYRKERLIKLAGQVRFRIITNQQISKVRQQEGYESAMKVLSNTQTRDLSKEIEAELVNIRSAEKQFQFATNEAVGNGNLQTLGAIWTLMTVAFMILLSMLFILKRYVTERLEAERKLAEREARMRAIVDTAPDGIVTFSDTGEIESANDAMQRMFGYGPGDLLKTQIASIMDNLFIQGKASDENVDLKTGERRIVGIGDEMLGRRQDGSTFPVEVALSLLNLGDRRIYTGIVRDITARREAEKRVSEFYSTVSHELRTPLTSIRTALGLMTSGAVGELSQKGGHLVKIAGGECDRLIRLINDILDFRKIEAGKLMLKPQTTTPKSLVETTFEAIKGLSDDAGVNLSTKIDFNTPIYCDPDRIVQVLTNLVSNAIKFSESGKEVQISVTAADSGRTRFSVIDHGPGIKPDQMNKLFAKFQQLDSSDTRKKGGTGLGLAISRAIVRQHGGDIEVETKYGRGSTFWFDLTPGDLLRGQHDDALTMHRLKALLVCDDERLTEPLKNVLAKSGFDLLRAATLAQAERIIEKTAPDILLMDPELADGSGLDLVRMEPETALLKGVPVIVFGGWNETSSTLYSPVLIDLQINPFDCNRLRRLASQAGIQAIHPKALLIEGDVARSCMLKTDLQNNGIMVLDELKKPIAESIYDLEPDVVVLDLSVSNERCFELLAEIRQDESSTLPLVVYTEQKLSGADISKLTLGFTRHLQNTGITTDEFCTSINRLMQGIIKTNQSVPDEVGTPS